MTDILRPRVLLHESPAERPAQVASPYPRVLVWTPTHPDYGIRPQTWASIEAALTAYEGPVHWVLSHNDNPYKQGESGPTHAREIGYLNVAHQHNTARQIALDGDYDALLSIEADMVIPPDTIARLLALEADVAYGLYCWRSDKIKHRWSAYTELGLFGGKSVVWDPSPDAIRAVWGKQIDVEGVGMGVTLISRKALELIKFRLYEGEPDDWLLEEIANTSRLIKFNIDPYRPRRGMLCDDWFLALDAGHYGLTQRCDLGLVCGHVNGGVTYWPDPDAEGFVRIEVNE